MYTQTIRSPHEISLKHTFHNPLSPPPHDRLKKALSSWSARIFNSLWGIEVVREANEYQAQPKGQHRQAQYD